MFNRPDVEAQLGYDWKPFVKCLDTIDNKLMRHLTRQDYYDMRNQLQSLDIALPPSIKMNPANGWCAKAVDSLSARVVLDSFTLPDEDIENYGLDTIYRDNNLDVLTSQAQTSAMINACSFVSVWNGDVANGEPPVITHVSDATKATGIYDPIRRRLSHGLIILETDTYGASHYIFLTANKAYGIIKDANNQWHVRTVTHNLGYVSMWILPYSPNLQRPFGRSRITRAMMSTVDSTLRTLARGEVSAEFFSAPQRYIMGVPEEAFGTANKWDAYLGRILALPHVELDSDDGLKFEAPQVGQFSQQSPEANIAHLRQWASLFAAESSLPLHSLGVISDNPSSAEAIHAAEKELIILAEQATRNFAPGWVSAMRAAAQLLNRSQTPIAELSDLSIRWRNPAYTSQAAQSDAISKLIGSGVYLADDPVTWAALDIPASEQQQMAAFRRRNATRAVIQASLAEQPTQPTTSPQNGLQTTVGVGDE